MRSAPEQLNVTLVSFPSFGPDIPAGAQLLVCYAGDRPGGGGCGDRAAARPARSRRVDDRAEALLRGARGRGPAASRNDRRRERVRARLQRCRDRRAARRSRGHAAVGPDDPGARRRVCAGPGRRDRVSAPRRRGVGRSSAASCRSTRMPRRSRPSVRTGTGSSEYVTGTYGNFRQNTDAGNRRAACTRARRTNGSPR